MRGRGIPGRGRGRGRGRPRRRTLRVSGEAQTLSTMRPHEVARVVRVAGGRRLVQRLAALGIVPGATITVDRASGPALIAVGHTRVAIGRQAAIAIEVVVDS